VGELVEEVKREAKSVGVSFLRLSYVLGFQCAFFASPPLAGFSGWLWRSGLLSRRMNVAPKENWYSFEEWRANNRHGWALSKCGLKRWGSD